MGRSGARQSKRYWGVKNPSFKEVAKRTKAACLDLVKRLEGSPKDFDWAHLQQTLLVGLQVITECFENFLSLHILQGFGSPDSRKAFSNSGS